LALTTLALSRVIKVVIENWRGLTRGHAGYSNFESFPGVPFSRLHYYYLALVFCAVVVSTLYLLAEHTRIGLAWRAIREDELRAHSLGLNVTRYKLAAFAVSAFVAGMGGSFLAHYITLVDPTMAHLNTTATLVAMAVLGGRASIFGAVIGAVVLEHLSQQLRALGVVYSDIATGALLVAILWLVPDGVVGLLRRVLGERRQRDQGSEEHTESI
jgi:branched-chain amino acid transport system permease protein